MPFYDVVRASTTNGTGATESTHLWGQTVANQETVYITGFYVAGRIATAGGAQARIKDNSGTTASGGTTQTARPRNIRAAPAAQSVWKNDATAITIGGTLTTRATIGWAQTGGTGGWIATESGAKIMMMPNLVSPVDMEFTTIATTTSVNFDMTVEFSEGIV
jgi:hypothetical protein